MDRKFIQLCKAFGMVSTLYVGCMVVFFTLRHVSDSFAYDPVTPAAHTSCSLTCPLPPEQ